MKPFIAVIGGKKSGKSTIIKSLTGCKSGAFEGEVQEKLHRTTIWVIAHSPQEREIPMEKLEKIFKDVAKDKKNLGIVIAIQPTEPTKRPLMEKIFEAAQRLKKYSLHAFIIDPPYQGESVVVAEIEKRLEKIKIQTIKTIDGRRFAIENAKYIQKVAGLP